MIWLLLVGVVIGLVVGLLLRNSAKPKYFAHAEYWVYLPTTVLPKQDGIMDQMLRANPQAGAIGPQEALIFSDIRLHIAIVQKAKNAHVFRPDLFAEDLEPTSEILERLAEAEAFAKVRFISEEPLQDKRHLQFVAHAAVAIAELGGGLVVYDPIAELLMTAEEFRERVLDERDATRPELQTRVIWRRHGGGGRAETRGLVKVGLQELATEEMDADQQVLVSEVMDEMIHKLWDEPRLPETSEVSVFEDLYIVNIQVARKGPARAMIMKSAGV